MQNKELVTLSLVLQNKEVPTGGTAWNLEEDDEGADGELPDAEEGSEEEVPEKDEALEAQCKRCLAKSFGVIKYVFMHTSVSVCDSTWQACWY